MNDTQIDTLISKIEFNKYLEPVKSEYREGYNDAIEVVLDIVKKMFPQKELPF